MENNTITRYRWFWAWQDEEEEQWLSEMASQGWHLVRPSLGHYIFRAGAPQPYIYRLDFRNETRHSLEDYFQLFHEAGWEHIGVLGGWQYWRKPVRSGETTEIYTDNASKIAKYQRLLALMVLPISMCIISFGNMLRMSDRITPFFAVLFFFLLLITVYATLRTWTRIRSLKRQSL